MYYFITFNLNELCSSIWYFFIVAVYYLKNKLAPVSTNSRFESTLELEILFVTWWKYALAPTYPFHFSKHQILTAKNPKVITNMDLTAQLKSLCFHNLIPAVNRQLWLPPGSWWNFLGPTKVFRIHEIFKRIISYCIIFNSM